MSSVESASMSSSDVSEKGPIDFGVKAVSLKSQAEANRLLQSGGPLRPLPSPSISRQSSGYQAQHIPLPSLGNVTQTKTVSFNKVTSGSGQAVGNMSSGTAITAKPPLSTSAVTSTTSLHGSTTTYLLPRGAAQQVQGPRASTTMGRASMTLQPVSSVQTLVRTQSPSSSQSGPVNHVRAPSPAGQPRTVVTARSTISAGKPTQTRSEVARPIVLPSTPNRPLTLTPTTQLHITTDNKTMKVPMGSVTQVLRPTLCSAFVGQNQTTILQRGDGVTLQGASPTTVLTTPVRLTPPLTPLLTTQRVAVSVGTRLTMQQHVTVTGSIPSAPRLPSPGIPNRNTIPSSGPSNASKMGVQPVGSNTIITTGRVAYATGQVVTGAAPLTRVAPQAAISSASNKPSSTPTMVTTSSRTPLANHLTGHVGGKPRFVRPQTGPPAAASSGLLVHSQLVVSSGNHGTTVRPALVTSTGTKVINQSLAGSIHLAAAPAVGKAPISIASPATNQLTPVISKPEVFKQMTPISMSRVVPPPKSYPLSPVQSSASSIGSSEGDQQHLTTQPQSTTVFIPGTQRTNITAGVVTTQSSLADRPGSTPTLNTYTLPSGTSYYYEAPSGYQLATDAPLVARPLSPDAPLVSRQLATEGPLIARPYTPGLIATSQAMRFNPVMIVDSASSASLPIVTTTGDTPNTSGNDPTTPAKLTSSPRPSILRKRDNEGNVGSKVVKNLAAALSGASSRSRTPSPPTSLHLETNQTNTDVGPSSNGSTTISATSSPGPEETPDPDRPTEMSPRKKPRKQLLNEATNDSIDMEFISEDKLKKEKEGASETNVDGDDDKVFVVKRPTSVSLLRQYKHNWKARNNHFQRYSDVKVREERRPSVTELANQRQIVQRVKGWKIYHLSTQFEDLSEMESCVLDRLSTIFKAMDNNLGKEFEKDVNRVNELIMGNIQRSKVIRDQMTEAKLQMMKGFDHKVHVSEIISRCASKRNFKKRDKY